MSYSSEVLADAPLAYYRLGEASGTALVDSSGNGHGGIYGGATRVAGLLTGDTDTAVSFDGTGTNAQVGDAAWMRVPTLSAEAVIRPTSAGVGAGSHTVVARNGQAGAAFLLRVDAGKLLGAIVPTTGGFKIANGATTLVAGTTYHVALTYDGTTVRLYLNGVQDGSVAFTGTISTVANSIPLSIGASGLSTPSEFFAGVIDEVAYYSGAVSQTRLAAHSTQVTAPTGVTITGTLAATLPSFSATLAGTSTAPAVTGTVAAALPPFTTALAGTATPPATTGTVAAVLAPFSATLAGTYVPGAAAVLAATLPPFSAALAGTSTALSVPPVTGTLDAALAAFVVDLAGNAVTSGPTIYGTDTTYANDSYTYGGTAQVDYDTPVAPPPPGLVRRDVRRVHQSLPTPDLVRGRPQ